MEHDLETNLKTNSNSFYMPRSNGGRSESMRDGAFMKSLNTGYQDKKVETF